MGSKAMGIKAKWVLLGIKIKHEEIGMKEKNYKMEKEEELDDDALELLLNEQLKKQVRSDYRRSLGNEHQRRYME